MAAELFTLFGRITTNATAAMAELGAVTGAAGKAGAAMTKSLGQVGGAMTGIIGPLGLMGMGLGFAALARTGVQNIRALDKAASDFQIATGASKGEADGFRRSLESLYRQHVDTWEEIAGTMNLVRQRYRETGEEAKRTTNLFLDWSDATGEDAANAVSTLSGILMGFNKPLSETARLMDMLKVAEQEVGGRGAAGQLTESLKMSSAAMTAAGMSYQDGIALLAVLQKRSVDAGVAVRGLGQFLKQMSDPTKDTASAMRTLGVEVDGLGKPIGGAKKVLAEIMDALKAAPGDMDKFNAAASLFGGMRFGQQFVRGLIAGSEALDDISKKLDNSEGAVKRAADLWDQQFGNTLIRVRKNVLEPIANDIGKVLIDALKALVGGLQDAKGNLDEAKMAAARFQVEIGLVAVAILAFVSMLPRVIAGTAAVATALTGPAGIILALGLLAAQFWLGKKAADAYAEALLQIRIAAMGPRQMGAHFAELPTEKQIEALTARIGQLRAAAEDARLHPFRIMRPEDYDKQIKELIGLRDAAGKVLKAQGGGGTGGGRGDGGAAAAEKKSAADLAQERIRELAAEYQLAEAQDLKLAKAIAYYTAVIAFIKRYRDSTVLAEKEAAAGFQDQLDKANEAGGSWGEFMDGLAKSAKGAEADITGFYNSLRSQMEQLRGASPAEELYKARVALSQATVGTDEYGQALQRVTFAERGLGETAEDAAKRVLALAQQLLAAIDVEIEHTGTGYAKKIALLDRLIAGEKDLQTQLQLQAERRQTLSSWMARDLALLDDERLTLEQQSDVLEQVLQKWQAIGDYAAVQDIEKRLRGINQALADQALTLDSIARRSLPDFESAFDKFYFDAIHKMATWHGLWVDIREAIQHAIAAILAAQTTQSLFKWAMPQVATPQVGGIATPQTDALTGALNAFAGAAPGMTQGLFGWVGAAVQFGVTTLMQQAAAVQQDVAAGIAMGAATANVTAGITMEAAGMAMGAAATAMGLAATTMGLAASTISAAMAGAGGLLGGIFQHGGIVTRPTLALIGEAGPEAVVPLGAAGAAGMHDLQASLLAKLWGGPRGEQQQNVYLEDGAIRLELSLDSLSPWDMYRAADRLADPFSRILMRRLATLPSY